MTTLHRVHDYAATVDEDDLLDRLAQERHDATAPTEPCTCAHDVEDHWPREGCVRQHCTCWWWA